ncbi:MAG TPA: winged helix-turn-helix domain-containing protein [Nitrososphaerales archaeon]|nr:winged helix-turn-helix domain-containing protein [Nitrososphaerales archaeon]
MKNRSRMEILYDIVSAAKSPVKKTNLMYKSNLSFKQLELYLDFLVEQGLVEVKHEIDGPGFMYGSTIKGFEFTNVFEDLQSYLSLPSALRADPNRLKHEVAQEPYPTPEIQVN